MRRNRWLILLSIALPLMFCGCLAACGLAGYLGNRLGSSLAEEMTVPLSTEPGPIPTPVRRQPTAAERETGQIVASASLPDRDLLELAHRLGPAHQGQPEVQASPSGAPALEIGDGQTFWLHDVHANSFYTTTATLQFETAHAYWWVEQGFSLSAKKLEQSASKFEAQTYPTNRHLFGEEWNPGIDGDPHIYIFLGDVPGVGGYFSGPDEYPAWVRPYSNEHEIFYINLGNAQPGEPYFDGILAHEFQHMIHWATDRDEDTWVNEGLSQLAGQVNGYDTGGSDYLFAMEPDTQLTAWPELEDSGPHYGASYLMLAYVFDQYGKDAIRRLVAEPANSIAGFDALLADVDPERGRFKDLFVDWVIANYLDAPGMGDGRYGYSQLRLDPPLHSGQHDAYPVLQQATVRQYAADYILLEGEEPLEIEFSGSQVVPLVGNTPHSGHYQWWSGRGDEGDATLTRAFDLGGLEQATLRAWLWYDLEVNYDYAYVEVSADEGQTWEILSNEHTSTTNPTGSSYGPGLTGLSGGESEARWVQQAFDLSSYAGRQILVRFEVITDDSVNHPGLCVDDVEIPELGYHSDVEEGPDGWQAAGWLRVTEYVPQEFVVQLIALGRATRVERMPLDAQMQGRLTLPDLGQDVERAILVVAAMAPATTEPATYSYEITSP